MSATAGDAACVQLKWIPPANRTRTRLTFGGAHEAITPARPFPAHRSIDQSIETKLSMQIPDPRDRQRWRHLEALAARTSAWALEADELSDERRVYFPSSNPTHDPLNPPPPHHHHHHKHSQRHDGQLEQVQPVVAGPRPAAARPGQAGRGARPSVRRGADAHGRRRLPPPGQPPPLPGRALPAPRPGAIHGACPCVEATIWAGLGRQPPSAAPVRALGRGPRPGLAMQLRPRCRSMRQRLIVFTWGAAPHKRPSH